MDRGWGLPTHWNTGVPAHPPEGTQDVNAGVSLEMLERMGFGKLASTAVSVEVLVTGTEG